MEGANMWDFQNCSRMGRVESDFSPPLHLPVAPVVPGGLRGCAAML